MIDIPTREAIEKKLLPKSGDSDEVIYQYILRKWFLREIKVSAKFAAPEVWAEEETSAIYEIRQQVVAEQIRAVLCTAPPVRHLTAEDISNIAWVLTQEMVSI